MQSFVTTILYLIIRPECKFERKYSVVELRGVVVLTRTSFLIILFSQYLRNVKVPCFFVTRQRKCSKQSYALFSLFPVIVYCMQISSLLSSISIV